MAAWFAAIACTGVSRNWGISQMIRKIRLISLLSSFLQFTLVIEIVLSDHRLILPNTREVLAEVFSVCNWANKPVRTRLLDLYQLIFVSSSCYSAYCFFRTATHELRLRGEHHEDNVLRGSSDQHLEGELWTFQPRCLQRGPTDRRLERPLHVHQITEDRARAVRHLCVFCCVHKML